MKIILTTVFSLLISFSATTFSSSANVITQMRDKGLKCNTMSATFKHLGHLTQSSPNGFSSVCIDTKNKIAYYAMYYWTGCAMKNGDQISGELVESSDITCSD
ncbi:MAG: hypothetical protein CMF55_01235 [Legionellales bacterium]|nr:hypothetical protein [Legionellales bacterium]